MGNLAANLAICAEKQEKFWQVHDMLFRLQEKLSVKKIQEVMVVNELDQDALKKCMSSTLVATTDIHQVPMTRIGPYALTGVQPVEKIEWIIRKTLSPNSL